MKDLLFSRFKILSNMFLGIGFSIFLLMVRMKLTHSFFYIFLVWNLFLAFVPFAITLYLSSKEKSNTYKLFFVLGVWLLFLPNAPYIITDIIHLRLSELHMVWIDILLVISFAFCGILCYLYSIKDMKSILKNHFNEKWTNLLFHLLPFVTAFGVYLGRFMRYNSWDIIHQPINIMTDCVDYIIHPFSHLGAWGFITFFGAFLSALYWIFSSLKTTT